jgi:hypothetical protein
MCPAPTSAPSPAGPLTEGRTSACVRTSRVDRALTCAWQWRLKQDEGKWMFKSDNDKYLGIAGPPRDGAMIVSADEPSHFDIRPDEGRPGAFKCALPIPA